MSHPDALSELFLGRSLGRIQVPRFLRTGKTSWKRYSSATVLGPYLFTKTSMKMVTRSMRWWTASNVYALASAIKSAEKRRRNEEVLKGLVDELCVAVRSGDFAVSASGSLFLAIVAYALEKGRHLGDFCVAGGDDVPGI